METFCSAKKMVYDPAFERKKARALSRLRPAALDEPMIGLVMGLNDLPYCFTIQSCHGHIMEPGKGLGRALKRLPAKDPPAKALYQLAYVALVVKKDHHGKRLLGDLARVAQGNPGFIQFGSAEWFWGRQGWVNSYALQVSPIRFSGCDRFEMERKEALAWIAARDQFMRGILDVLRARGLEK